MKKGVFLFVFCISLLPLNASAQHLYSPYQSWAVQYAAYNESKLQDPYTGWHVLSDDYAAPHFLDGLSLEWDYYAFTNMDGTFTGTIGITVNDPRGHLGNDSGKIAPGIPSLQPSGGNAAIIGRFADGVKKAEFLHFGLFNGTTKKAGKDLRTFDCAMDDGTGYAKQYPLPDGAGGYAGIKLKGQSPTMTWDLTVTPLWPERLKNRGKTWRIGDDVGIISGEHFTVNSIWLSIQVTGTIVRRDLNESIAIDAVGYREDSFGRYAFITGGWDFTFGLDPANKTEFMIQTFYPFSKKLDYMYVQFEKDGQDVFREFRADRGQLTWRHDDWHWNDAAKICHPSTTQLQAEDADYEIEISADIEKEYAPILSDITPMTHLYVITELMPTFTGTIRDKSTSLIIDNFSGTGGGEYSVLRNLSGITPSDAVCTKMHTPFISRIISH